MVVDALVKLLGKAEFKPTKDGKTYLSLWTPKEVVLTKNTPIKIWPNSHSATVINSATKESVVVPMGTTVNVLEVSTNRHHGVQFYRIQTSQNSKDSKNSVSGWILPDKKLRAKLVL